MTPPAPTPSDAQPLLNAGSAFVLLLGLIALACVVAFRKRILDFAALRDRASRAREIPGGRWALAGFAGWCTWVFGMAAAASFLSRSGEPPSLPDAALWSAPAYVLGVVAVAAALWTVRRPAMRAGMTVAPRDAISGAVGIILGLPIMLSVGVLMFAAASFLSRVSDAPPPDEVAHGTLRQILDLHAESGLSWWALSIAFQVVVLAPILEEVLYRGCLQSALAHLRIGPRTRIVAASAVFASIHVSAVPWHAMPTLFAVGAICGYAFERTGRLGAPILIHAAFNALNLGMALAAAG